MSKNSAIKVTETQVFIGYVSERCTARSGQMTSRTLFDELRVELSFAIAPAIACRSLITNSANPVPTAEDGLTRDQ
jgi:hypothetical protein